MRHWLLAFAAAPLAAALPALAQEAAPFRMHYWDGGWGMMLFGPFFMLLTIAAVVALVVWVLRGLGGSPGGGTVGGRNAVEILKERFARGEIDKEEFEERRRLLER